MANWSVSHVYLSWNIHSIFNIKWHFLCFIPLSIKFIYFKCLSPFNKSVKMFVFEFCGNDQVCLLLFCKLILMITNCSYFNIHVNINWVWIWYQFTPILKMNTNMTRLFINSDKQWKEKYLYLWDSFSFFLNKWTLLLN